MYENEFNSALQAIAESVTESDFDAIVEGAAILLEENEGMSMDEAVQASAAMLYNEDAIGDESFAVTDAVIDEFTNQPVNWGDALEAIAEAVGADTFNDMMNEAVGAMLDNLSEAYKRDGLQNTWEGAKAQGMTKKEFVAQMGLDKKGVKTPNPGPSADDKARKNQADKQSREQATAAARARLSVKLADKKKANEGKALTAGVKSGFEAGEKFGTSQGFNRGFAQGAKAGGAAGERKGNAAGMKKGAAIGVAGTAAAAGAAYGAKKLYDKIQANKAAKAAEEAKLSNKVKAKIEEGKEKAGEVVNKVKEKVSPKNEDASDAVYTLKDLRALAEAVQTTEEQEQ